MTANQENRSVMVRAFVGESGLRPVWRFVLFAIGIVVLSQLIREGKIFLLLAHAFGINLRLLSPQLLILSELLNLIVVLIVTGVAAWLEHRRVDSYGLPAAAAFRSHFWEGVAMGLVTVALVGIGMIATGGMRIHGIALHGADALRFPLLWLVAMVLVGLSEEYIFRGYVLHSLGRGIGFWPAALVTSVLFAGAHVNKPHENAIDIGMIFALAIMICFALARTGTLWLAVGWHTAFDFGQFFVIGTRNGGQVPFGHLFDVTFPGPAWSNGGPLGTEASLFMIPMIVISFIYIAWRYPRREGTFNSPVPAQ